MTSPLPSGSPPIKASGRGYLLFFNHNSSHPLKGTGQTLGPAGLPQSGWALQQGWKAGTLFRALGAEQLWHPWPYDTHRDHPHAVVGLFSWGVGSTEPTGRPGGAVPGLMLGVSPPHAGSRTCDMASQSRGFPCCLEGLTQPSPRSPECPGTEVAMKGTE